VKCLLVPQIFDVDRFTWVEAKSFTQFLHFIIEKIDLLLTAVDALCILLHLPDKHTQPVSVSHVVTSLTAERERVYLSVTNMKK